MQNHIVSNSDLTMQHLIGGNESDFIINYENVKFILKQTSNNNNQIRNKMESLIISKKYNIHLYECLFAIYNHTSEDKIIKIQAILILKNLLRIELSSHNKGNYKNLNQTVEINKEFKEIVSFIKVKIIELINSGKYQGNDKLHLKEIILLIADKFFPHEWNELTNIFSIIYAFDTSKINNENVNDLINISDLFFSILKQQNRKRTLSTRTRFYKVKDLYINMICSFYENMNKFFLQNLERIESNTFIEQIFNILIILDKTLLLLIDCSFNINDLYKDQNYIKMLKLSLNKGEFLLNMLNSSNNLITLRILYLNNLYSLVKYLAKIQTIFPILFFDDFNVYMNLLLSALFNISILNENVVKIILFALFKVFNTQLYKDNLKEDMFACTQVKENTPIRSNSMKKPSNLKGIALIVSPTKLKNYENELISVTSKFNDYFNEEILSKLLDLNLSVLPSFFKTFNNQTNQNEIDFLIGETDDEIFTHDTFSQNTMDWQVIQRSLLRSFFEIFTSYCLKYLRNKLEFIYKNSQVVDTNCNEFEAIVNFANIIPHLYREGIIIETQMIQIDYNKMLSFIQSLAVSKEIYLKIYIITISKWSDILIINENIFEYVHHLLEILAISKNNFILCESCLALKIIINNLDKHVKENKKFSVFEDKDKLKENIKSKINWAEALKIVSKVGLNIINLSPDILLIIINLFTSLIEKCHYQCESNLLDIIQSSSLLQIISQTTHEFGHNALIDMWKALLLLFQDNEVIINYSLEYITFCFGKEVDGNNLSLLLFLLRVIEEKQYDKNIKNTILKFINTHFTILIKNYSQYLNNIIINIFEEIVLFDVIEYEKIATLFEFSKVRLIPAFEMTNSLLQRNDNDVSSNDFIFTDLCEYKTSIYSLLNSIFIKFYQEKQIQEIIKYYDIFLIYIFQELINSKGKSSNIYTNVYITNLISLLNRITIFEFEFFQINLRKFLTENPLITYEIILTEWLKKMENTISSENRKINTIVISNFFILMSQEEFLKFFNQMCNISLFTVHSLMTTKIQYSVDGFENSSNLVQDYKTLNIRISSRKHLLIKKDSLLTKVDIFNYYKESLTQLLNKYNISLDSLLTNLVKNKTFFKRLNDIFGKSQLNDEEF